MNGNIILIVGYILGLAGMLTLFIKQGVRKEEWFIIIGGLCFWTLVFVWFGLLANGYIT